VEQYIRFAVPEKGLPQTAHVPSTNRRFAASARPSSLAFLVGLGFVFMVIW